LTAKKYILQLVNNGTFLNDKRPSLKELDILDLELQQFKAEFFKALAHPLRIKILEVLAQGDFGVNEIQSAVGSEGSTVSQQLMVLRNKNIVVGTKNGNRVIYSLRDPLIIDLLEVAKQIFNNHLVDTLNILDKFQDGEAKEAEEQREQYKKG
jgi:DNA-binding transcriptional ArsR family regulator